MYANPCFCISFEIDNGSVVFIYQIAHFSELHFREVAFDQVNNAHASYYIFLLLFDTPYKTHIYLGNLTHFFANNMRGDACGQFIIRNN